VGKTNLSQAWGHLCLNIILNTAKYRGTIKLLKNSRRIPQTIISAPPSIIKEEYLRKEP